MDYEYKKCTGALGPLNHAFDGIRRGVFLIVRENAIKWLIASRGTRWLRGWRVLKLFKNDGAHLVSREQTLVRIRDQKKAESGNRATQHHAEFKLSLIHI